MDQSIKSFEEVQIGDIAYFADDHSLEEGPILWKGTFKEFTERYTNSDGLTRYWDGEDLEDDHPVVLVMTESELEGKQRTAFNYNVDPSGVVVFKESTKTKNMPQIKRKPQPMTTAEKIAEGNRLLNEAMEEIKKSQQVNVDQFIRELEIAGHQQWLIDALNNYGDGKLIWLEEAGDLQELYKIFKEPEFQKDTCNIWRAHEYLSIFQSVEEHFEDRDWEKFWEIPTFKKFKEQYPLVCQLFLNWA